MCELRRTTRLNNCQSVGDEKEGSTMTKTLILTRTVWLSTAAVLWHQNQMPISLHVKCPSVSKWTWPCVPLHLFQSFRKKWHSNSRPVGKIYFRLIICTFCGQTGKILDYWVCSQMWIFQERRTTESPHGVYRIWHRPIWEFSISE